jgi:hypothetical protein
VNVSTSGALRSLLRESHTSFTVDVYRVALTNQLSARNQINRGFGYLLGKDVDAARYNTFTFVTRRYPRLYPQQMGKSSDTPHRHLGSHWADGERKAARTNPRPSLTVLKHAGPRPGCTVPAKCRSALGSARHPPTSGSRF